MEKKWYFSFVGELSNSYNNRIVVLDIDRISLIKEIQEELENHYAIHDYENELKLRAFLSKISSSTKKVIIFKHSDKSYFPSDVENNSDEIQWSLKSVFQKLDTSVVLSFPAKLYQQLYAAYLRDSISLKSLDQNETLNYIVSSLWEMHLSDITSREKLIFFLYKVYETCDQVPLPFLQFKDNKSLKIEDKAWEGSVNFKDWISTEFNSLNKKRTSEINFDSDEMFIIKEKLEVSKEKDSQSAIYQYKDYIYSLLKEEKIDWLSLARKWGELSYLKDKKSTGTVFSEEEYLKLDHKICELFEPYIIDNHSKTFVKNSSNNLVTIDKVLHYLRYRDGKKKLLFCFDGMAFQEWYLIKSYLENFDDFKFNENAIYALLPTVTSVSRRALFCGEKNTDLHASDDSKGFINAVLNWENIDKKDIFFCFTENIEWQGIYKEYRYIGMVSNIVDETAHRTENSGQNKKLMQDILRLKFKQTGIVEMFRKFLQEGFRIFITSDHGTIWCEGNGLGIEKYMINSRSKRALIYPNFSLGFDYHNSNKEGTYVYSDNKVLGEKSVVFPKGRNMFAKEGYSAISHGGIHIEEVLIPFVEVLL